MGITSVQTDEYWMQQALAAAKHAQRQDEVPVGAVLVRDNEIVASASNSPISLNDPSAHAEVLVLHKAAQQLNNYRLPDSTLYVTLEPCMMCAGIMLHARVKRLVFGAFDPKTGVAGGCFDWTQAQKHTHEIEVCGGVLENDCSLMLKNFFQQKRRKN